MTKTPLETAKNVAANLHSLISLLDPRARNAIGPLRFADDYAVISSELKSCIDRLPPVKDLDEALAHLGLARTSYTDYYNGRQVGDLHSADIVGCMKDMCCLRLRIARAHIQKAIDDGMLGDMK